MVSKFVKFDVTFDLSFYLTRFQILIRLSSITKNIVCYGICKKGEKICPQTLGLRRCYSPTSTIVMALVYFIISNQVNHKNMHGLTVFNLVLIHFFSGIYVYFYVMGGLGVCCLLGDHVTHPIRLKFQLQLLDRGLDTIASKPFRHINKIVPNFAN